MAENESPLPRFYPRCNSSKAHRHQNFHPPTSRHSDFPETHSTGGLPESQSATKGSLKRPEGYMEKEAAVSAGCLSHILACYRDGLEACLPLRNTRSPRGFKSQLVFSSKLLPGVDKVPNSSFPVHYPDKTRVSTQKIGCLRYSGNPQPTEQSRLMNQKGVAAYALPTSFRQPLSKGRDGCVCCCSGSLFELNTCLAGEVPEGKGWLTEDKFRRTALSEQGTRILPPPLGFWRSSGAGMPSEAWLSVGFTGDVRGDGRVKWGGSQNCLGLVLRQFSLSPILKKTKRKKMEVLCL